MTFPRIGVTLGDPGGIGPEIVLKTLARPEAVPPAAYIVFGDSRVIEEEERAAGLSLDARPCPAGGPDGPGVYIAGVPVPLSADGPSGVRSDDGRASFRFFEEAVAAAGKGAVEALVTAPVSKASWKSAGIPWRGHTDYLEHLYPGAIMSFWSDSLRVALFTHHLPLREAVERIKKEALLGFLLGLGRASARIPEGPREFLVAGLNPHAGEDGCLGTEEEEEIAPAVEAARREGLAVSGPWPADTMFLRARGRAGAMAVALFHDQGLIAFKLEAFASGVNATLGLPFARTSPDHGTAFDIAGQGVADPRAMIEAVRLAVRFAGR